ncbi:hypothetical protein D3C84_1316300 [compost metagenome]
MVVCVGHVGNGFTGRGADHGQLIAVTALNGAAINEQSVLAGQEGLYLWKKFNIAHAGIPLGS